MVHSRIRHVYTCLFIRGTFDDVLLLQHLVSGSSRLAIGCQRPLFRLNPKPDLNGLDQNRIKRFGVDFHFSLTNSAFDGKSIHLLRGTIEVYTDLDLAGAGLGLDLSVAGTVSGTETWMDMVNGHGYVQGQDRDCGLW